MKTILKIKDILPFLPYFIKRILLLTEFFLFVRLALKWLDASDRAFIVSVFYSFTDFLTRPFNFIFPNINLNDGGIIDIVSISAMIGYLIIAYIILGILKLFYGEKTEEGN